MKLNRSLGVELEIFTLYEYFKKLSENIIEETPLTYKEYIVLAYIYNGNRVSQYDIIKRSGFKKVRINQIIKSLKEKNYIFLEEENSGNRVRKIPTLTEEGTLLMKNIYLEIENRYYEKVSEIEYENFLEKVHCLKEIKEILISNFKEDLKNWKIYKKNWKNHIIVLI